MPPPPPTAPRPEPSRAAHGAAGEPRWRRALRGLLHHLGTLHGWRLSLLLVLSSALLSLPSVFTGLRTEDFYHLTAVKRGTVELPWRVNLFNYFDGDVGTIYGVKDFGTLPWFTLHDHRVAFFRPLSSFTHVVDYTYFPTAPWLAHLHSLGWYALLVLAVTRLYRRLSGPTWLAALAALLYAWDDAHAHPVGWLANRNAIMATLFGVLALWAHDAWRRPRQLGAAPAGSKSVSLTLVSAAAPHGERAGLGGGALSTPSAEDRSASLPQASGVRRWLAGLLAPLCLALGLLAGEYAVGAVGYVAAHACLLDEAAHARRGLRRWLTRLLVLLPSITVTVAWLVVYRRLGFGTYGTDFHLDPLADTERYTLELLWRWPALVSAQLFGVDSESWWRLSTPALITCALAAWAALLVSLYYFRASLRDRVARFWLVGMALATLPACAALPQDRLLFFTGLGAFALIALAVQRCLEAGAVRRLAAALTLALLLFTHGVIAPMTFPQRGLIMHRFGDELSAVGEAITRAHPDPNEHLVLLGGPSYFYVASTLGLRATRGEPVPRHIRMLHAGRGPISALREAPSRLVLSLPHGLYNDPFDGTYRGTQHPMKVGDGLQLTWMLLIVRQVNERGVPTEVEVNFQREVRRGHFHFMAWQPPRAPGGVGHFRELDLPAVGERVELPGGY